MVPVQSMIKYVAFGQLDLSFQINVSSSNRYTAHLLLSLDKSSYPKVASNDQYIRSKMVLQDKSTCQKVVDSAIEQISVI